MPSNPYEYYCHLCNASTTPHKILRLPLKPVFILIKPQLTTHIYCTFTFTQEFPLSCYRVSFNFILFNGIILGLLQLGEENRPFRSEIERTVPTRGHGFAS